MNPIDVRGLYKRYGEVEAVRDVSFSVQEATIFGLIGPDGGGKTTIMRTIVSLLSIDAGEVFFQGKKVDQSADYVRSHIGYMPQRFSLYQDLTVEENLHFFADLFGVPRCEKQSRIDQLYEFSTLAPFKKRRAGALSGGMKQKLALSCMLAHKPAVIVLDEPTFGVDPVSRHDFWEILKTLVGQGTTILVSTAYMDEALLCDRVALVYKGRVLASDTPSRLKERYREPLFVATSDAPHQVFRVLQGSSLCTECELFGDGVHFTLAPGATEDGVLRAIEEAGVVSSGILRHKPSLEDLFLKLMKE